MRAKPIRKRKETQNKMPKKRRKWTFLTTTTDIDRSLADEVSAKSRASCQRGLTDGLC
jgi:hypothetical protein